MPYLNCIRILWNFFLFELKLHFTWWLQRRNNKKQHQQQKQIQTQQVQVQVPQKTAKATSDKTKTKRQNSLKSLSQQVIQHHYNGPPDCLSVRLSVHLFSFNMQTKRHIASPSIYPSRRPSVHPFVSETPVLLSPAILISFVPQMVVLIDRK